MMSPLAMLALQVEPNSQTGMSESFRLQEAPEAWVIVLVIVPTLFLIAWFSYRKEPIAPGARLTLTLLRFGALLILSLILCRPVMIERREEVHPAEVVVLVDDSASMQRSEAYNGDAQARAAVQQLTGSIDAESMRLDLARASLNKTILPELAKRGYDTRMYRFSDTATPMLRAEELAGAGHSTNLGDALTQVLASHRGRSTTDVIIVSDGRSNGGMPALDAARAASSRWPPHSTPSCSVILAPS